MLEITIGVFLHGKIGIRWWDITTNSWSSETCKVEEIDGYYVSKCTHLTDFTLLVDGIKTDPILCDKVLEIVNYIVSIGSMFSLLVLNVIYIIILIPPLSQKIFSNIFLKIVPKSDKNIAAFIYSFLLFLFFFIFTLFTNQDQVVIKTGCYIVAALNYWLLMTFV
uniref:GPS domain-containing protein n=1 Tax=Panagrolaimus superbus TaxID=310955 RepID=A0A914YQC9_9BILA